MVDTNVCLTIVGIDKAVRLSGALIDIVDKTTSRVGSGKEGEMAEKVAAEHVLNQVILGSSEGGQPSSNQKSRSMHLE